MFLLLSCSDGGHEDSSLSFLLWEALCVSDSELCKKEMLSEYKKTVTSVQGRKKKRVKILGGIKTTSGETDFYMTAKQRGNAVCSCKYIRNY